MGDKPNNKNFKMAAGILAGVFAAAAAITFLGKEPESDPPKPEPIHTNDKQPKSIFRSKAEEIISGQRTPRYITAAHIEDTKYFVNNMFSFEYHGRTAYRILDWQNNGSVNTNLYDYDPFQYTDYNMELIDFFDVISISSTVGGLNITIDQDAIDDLWERSNAVAVMATGNNGNSLCPARFNRDAQEEVYKLGRSIYSSGDTVVRVGAISNGAIPCYSSENQPDFVYETAFDQGFCTEYYMTQPEIDAVMGQFPQYLEDYYRQALGPDTFTAHQEAGSQSCDINGTSFVSPNVARLFSQILSEYPDLHEYELIATAFLASERVDYSTNAAAPRQEQDYAVINARGLRSDRISGFGAYDPDRHREIIEELLQYKQAANLQTETVRLESDGAYTKLANSPAGYSSYSVTIEDPGTVLRSVIEMRIDFDTGKTIYDQSIPEEIILVSPSGTEMKLIAIDDLRSQKDAAGYHLSGAASAFFGEEAQGKWIIRIPDKGNGAALTINEMNLLQWSVKEGGAIDIYLDIRDGASPAVAPAPQHGLAPNP